jgi:alanyl-tRNA synthetase
MMTSAEIRQAFLDFFKERGHTVVPSASLIPTDDPTLLFTNAGMNQFKDVFLGVGTRPYKRAADTQKVMRVAGKHNDLEDVGRDTRHHTMFEMLGNWSFGDYYKKEAIAWAWELLTEVWGLPKERLWATCFKDEQGILETDEEAAGYWRQQPGMDPSHVLYDGRKDNFWEMGDTGPCGPCSEIHYDYGPEACEKQGVPGHICRVNGDCERFFEFWNLVFIQYNRTSPTQLDPLPAKHVDTGMGFERIVSILQGVDSNYKTDLFTPIIKRTQELLGHSDAQVEEAIVAYRVIADHGRAVTFLIGDGALPGNVGRGYVLRMILRRAARFGRMAGFREPFLAEIAKVVIREMGGYFTEIKARQEFILNVINQEEERFYQTYEYGLKLLIELIDGLKAQGKTTVPGADSFKLHATYGFPFELTRDIATEHGLLVDEEGFRQAMAEHERISASDRFKLTGEEALAVYANLLEKLKAGGKVGAEGVKQDPYYDTEMESSVLAIIRNGQPVREAREGEEVELVLAATSFYAESGGQMSDTGFIAHYEDPDAPPTWQFQVADMHKPVSGLVTHVGQMASGTARVGDAALAVVDLERRWDIMRNHTATHLLHSELRYILGEHVHQAGSLVAPDRLRFDFTHPAMLTKEELQAIESSVNDAILANYPIRPEQHAYKEAVAAGAMALFGEKYGDEVRVVKIGDEESPFSQELCGGTHVSYTGDIGSFHILSEGSVAAGVRRIEAVTGRHAYELAQKRMAVLDSAAAFLGCSPEEVDRKILGLMGQIQELEKAIEKLRRQQARQDFERLLGRTQEVNGVRVLSAQVEAADVAMLREMSDWFRERMGSGVIVLGAVLAGKPNFIAAVTPDLVERGLHAGNLVKAVAQEVGGGGGGKPTMAQAGGRDAARLPEALSHVPGLVEQALKG